MVIKDMNSENLEKLQDYFSRPACQKATSPLRTGLEISLNVGEDSFTLLKQKSGVEVVGTKAANPDLTCIVPAGAIDSLRASYSDDIGEIGVNILKLMASSNPNEKIAVKVHIGAWDFIRGGYLGVLPLGGPSVMKHLASKGLTGIGKIKDAISKLREERK